MSYSTFAAFLIALEIVKISVRKCKIIFRDSISKWYEWKFCIPSSHRMLFIDIMIFSCMLLLFSCLLFSIIHWMNNKCGFFPSKGTYRKEERCVEYEQFFTNFYYFILFSLNVEWWKRSTNGIWKSLLSQFRNVNQLTFFMRFVYQAIFFNISFSLLFSQLKNSTRNDCSRTHNI
jgi:hypothetical protein